MKKLLSIGLALTICAPLLTGTADAYTAIQDSLNQASTVSVSRARQASYLDALRLRYKNMYFRSQRDRFYKNSYIQDYRLEQVQKDNHIVGILGSEMNREGEMEQDKDRVRTVDTNRVQAVNPKQIFRKRAIDYYVLGGDAGSEAMDMGNIDGMKNQVTRKNVFSEMYKMSIGSTNLTTRDMIRNIGLHRGEVGVDKPSTYSTGSFNSRMISPYMSTSWMQR